VALDAKFVVGHAQLDHPGDPQGSADETVNVPLRNVDLGRG
jgi:hypothetical protein